MSEEMLEELQNMNEQELIDVQIKIAELLNKISKITEQNGDV